MTISNILSDIATLMESELSKKKSMLILASVFGTWETTKSLRLREIAF